MQGNQRIDKVQRNLKRRRNAINMKSYRQARINTKVWREKSMKRIKQKNVRTQMTTISQCNRKGETAIDLHTA